MTFEYDVAKFTNFTIIITYNIIFFIKYSLAIFFLAQSSRIYFTYIVLMRATGL